MVLPISRTQRSSLESYLDEANVGGLLTEALTADIETVLADQTGAVGADTAVERGHCQYTFHSQTPAQPGFVFVSPYQDREPLPYLRGREFQTDS